MESLDYPSMSPEWLTKNSNIVGNHINSENVVKEFKKLTKARKSWKPTANKRGSKRKSDYMKQNVKRVKVKLELSWTAYYLMEWIFPIQFSFRECFDE